MLMSILISGEPVINFGSRTVFVAGSKNAILSLGVRMLAAAGLPYTFWEKSQTTSKKRHTGL